MAALGSAVGMRVLGWSRRNVRLPGVETVALDELLAASDVISVNVALTDETRLLLDARRLSLIGREAVLINTARGEILDTDALCRALAEGRPGRRRASTSSPASPCHRSARENWGPFANLILTRTSRG